MVDIATECLMDLATASISLDRAATDIDSFWWHKQATEENRSACELITLICELSFPRILDFLLGQNIFLVEMSKSEASGSSRGRFSVGKYWFWLLYDLVGAKDETKC